LAQICTKSFVGWGFAPDPTGGAYSAPPDPLAGLRGPTSKGRGREGEGEGRGMGTTSFWTLPPPLVVYRLTSQSNRGHINKNNVHTHTSSC